MIEKGLIDLDVNHFEYCFLLEDTSAGASYFKMNVPKIMPLIPQGDPISVTTPYNNNIFINDPACKPQASPTIDIQNFITLPKFRNTNMPKVKDPDGDGIIPKGERFIVVVMDHNIKDIYVTDNI